MPRFNSLYLLSHSRMVLLTVIAGACFTSACAALRLIDDFGKPVSLNDTINSFNYSYMRFCAESDDHGEWEPVIANWEIPYDSIYNKERFISSECHCFNSDYTINGTMVISYETDTLRVPINIYHIYIDYFPSISQLFTADTVRPGDTLTFLLFGLDDDIFSGYDLCNPSEVCSTSLSYSFYSSCQQLETELIAGGKRREFDSSFVKCGNDTARLIFRNIPDTGCCRLMFSITTSKETLRDTSRIIFLDPNRTGISSTPVRKNESQSVASSYEQTSGACGSCGTGSGLALLPALLLRLPFLSRKKKSKT